MENQNHKLRIKIGESEHDVFVSTTNFLALSSGAMIYYEGKMYVPKITTYLLPTATNFYMDQVPLLELV